MNAKRHPQHADISPEAWSQIDRVIAAQRSVPGALITVLRECQAVVGYLPPVLLDYIAKGLNLPPSRVFGVVTFYALFSLQPKGRHTIKVCLGTACYVKGIQEVIGRISRQYGLEAGRTSADRRFSLEVVRCLGACGLAPVTVVDQDIHGGMRPDRVVDVLEGYP